MLLRLSGSARRQHAGEKFGACKKPNSRMRFLPIIDRTFMTDTSAPRDPLPILLLVLTATTGLVDAVSVLGLGRVFTANMTGNVVFLGFAIAGAPGFSIARALVSLAGFVVGAMLGGRLGITMAGVARRRWLLSVAVVEAGLCFVAALVAVGYDMDTLT